MAVPDAHVLYGDALSAAGRYADAAEAYQKAGNLAFTEGTALRMVAAFGRAGNPASRSEEHTSELQSLMRISYAVFCLKKKKNNNKSDMTEKIKIMKSIYQ